MATRYWVGGTGTWNTSSTTNWSATSGGASGASAPTSADIATFDANSGSGAITISVTVSCLDFVASAIPATLTWTPTSGINCYGSFNMGSNGTLTATAGINVNFVGPNSGRTVTCSPAAAIFRDLTFGDTTYAVSTGGWTFSSAIQANNIYLYTGTLDTNGQTVTVGNYFGDKGLGSGTRTITLGASTINCGTVAITTSGVAVQLGIFNANNYSTGTTFNANTSTINIGSVTNNTGSTVTGLNIGFLQSESTAITFNNVNLYGLYLATHGACTFANLSVTAAQFNAAASWNVMQQLVLFGDLTVTGVLTLQGSNAGSQRLTVKSSSLGASKTITASNATASTKTLKWVNFQDITLTNSGSALGPLTLVGDCGGNTFPASTFDAAITCYAKNSVAATFWSSAIWFTTSGGSTAARVPLPQDNAVFDANTGNFYVQIDIPYLSSNINTTGWTSFVQIVSGMQFVPQMYGTLTNPSNQFQSNIIYAGRSNISLGSTNIVTSRSNIFIIPGFTVTLTANYNTTSHLAIVSGTLTTNNFNITTDYFDTNIASLSTGITQTISSLPTVNLGSSTVTINGGTYNYIQFVSGATLNAGTSTITLNRTATANTYADFVCNGQTFNNIVLNATTVAADGYTNQFRFSGSGGTFAGITSTGTAPCSLWLANSVTYTFTNFNLTGTASASILISCGYNGSVNGGSQAASTATIAVANNSSTSYVAYWGITKSGVGTLSASGVANISRNSGINFTSTVTGLVYTGSVGSTATGSFTVPANYQGSNLCIVYGGGGGAGRPTTGGQGGAGSGRMAVFSNLNNISAGSTVYYQAGQGGTGATTTATAGAAGATSWLNNVTNTTPTTINQGIYASGAGGSSAGTFGSSGGATSSSQILIPSGAGANAQSNSASGGAGGAAPTLYTMFSYSAASPSTGAQSGGGGGGGALGDGLVSAVATGGSGGLNLSSAAATGGGAGVAGNAGTLGGGGGGGGFATTLNTNGGAGGGSGYGAEYNITQLNGTGISSTAFGGSGGGGAGGAGNGTGTGGVGGAPLIAAGGGGGGGGGTTGNGGNGGVGAVIFLYTIPATQIGRSYAVFLG